MSAITRWSPRAFKLIVETEKSVGGQLGRPSGARFRTYERLKAYAEPSRGTLFATPELLKAIEDIYKCPLLQSATDTLNRQIKSGISNEESAELVMSLRADARLCRVAEDMESTEPQVICSMGLRSFSYCTRPRRLLIEPKPLLSHFFSRNPRMKSFQRWTRRYVPKTDLPRCRSFSKT